MFLWRKILQLALVILCLIVMVEIWSNLRKYYRNPAADDTVYWPEWRKDLADAVRVKQSNDLHEVKVLKYQNGEFSRQKLPNNLNGRKVDLRTPNGHTAIYIHDTSVDAAISRKIRDNHEWEPELVRLIVKIVANNPEFTFIDVGCNLGVYALSVAKTGRTVIAIDPLSMNINNIYKSAKAGNFTNPFFIIQNAVSNKHMNVTLGIDNLNVGGTYVVENKNENKLKITAQGGTYKDKVTTMMLDDLTYFPEVTLSHVIMKTDVEGSELRVLLGGKKFFDRIKVGAILMEWLFYKSGETASEIIRFLKARHFSPYNAYSPETELDEYRRHEWPDDVIWINKNILPISLH